MVVWKGVGGWSGRGGWWCGDVFGRREGGEAVLEEEDFAAEVDTLFCCGFGGVGFAEELGGVVFEFGAED